MEWLEYWDLSSEAPYYYNIKTGETTWDLPEKSTIQVEHSREKHNERESSNFTTEGVYTFAENELGYSDYSAYANVEYNGQISQYYDTYAEYSDHNYSSDTYYDSSTEIVSRAVVRPTSRNAPWSDASGSRLGTIIETEESENLNRHWTVLWDHTLGAPYYYNSTTGESRWTLD